MLIVSCGDSYTQGEGLEKQEQAYPYRVATQLNAKITNLAQSGASEYLITSQVEQAVKLKPDLIVIGHTSEYRWQTWDFRNDQWQGFLVANHVMQNEKYYRNWILSRLWSGAVSKQIILCTRAGIPVVHHCCFPHLQSELVQLTDDYIDFNLDIEKIKDPAPDRSHAGFMSHLKLAKFIVNRTKQIL